MVSGSTSETKDSIVRTIRNADEPALSAADIADRANYSKRTVNNHMSDLLASGRVENTKIGNATAYYVDKTEYPTHSLPDHHCKRCGREVNDNQDSSWLECTQKFGDDPRTYSYILCRFCQSDLTSWLNSDDGSMYDYPSVHQWDVPEHQIEDIRNQDDVQSSPNLDLKNDILQDVADAVEKLSGPSLDDGVEKDTLLAEIESDYSAEMVEQALSKLVSRGYVYKSYLPESYVRAE